MRAVLRADDIEVAEVNGRHRSDVETLGGGDHRRVDSAQWQVAVDTGQLGDSEPVRRVHGFNRESA